MVGGRGLLRAAIFTLGFPELVRWLAHRPRDPKLFVEAIAALAPGPDSLAAWHLVQHAEAIGRDSWGLLAERLQPVLNLPSWNDALLPFDAQSGTERLFSDPDDANPIGWLVKHGVPRSELVALALEGIVVPDVSEATLAQVIRWLGEQLVTRSAWESYGEAVLHRFYARWGWDLLGPLFQLLDHAIERSRALAGGDGKST